MSAEIPLVYAFPDPVSALRDSFDPFDTTNSREVAEGGPVILLAPVRLPVAVYCYDENLKKKYYGNLMDLTEHKQIIEVEKVTTIDGVKLEHERSACGVNTEEDRKLRGSTGVGISTSISSSIGTSNGWHDWKRADNHLPIITLLPQGVSALQVLFA